MKVSFILNGNKVNIEVDPFKSLLRLLKEDLEVNSVKEGCARGECGTCTVLMDGKALTSCMVAAGQLQGREVKTLEGLEEEREVSVIQDGFVRCGAVQCGFCTPGFIISAYALLEDNPSPSREEIRRAVAGNICRCTGYSKIIDGVEMAAEVLRKK